MRQEVGVTAMQLTSVTARHLTREIIYDSDEKHLTNYVTIL